MSTEPLVYSVEGFFINSVCADCGCTNSKDYGDCAHCDSDDVGIPFELHNYMKAALEVFRDVHEAILHQKGFKVSIQI